MLNSARPRGVAGEPFVVESGDDLRIRVAAGFDADELARLVEGRPLVAQGGKHSPR